jgi:hypothetical protein
MRAWYVSIDRKGKVTGRYLFRSSTWVALIFCFSLKETKRSVSEYARGSHFFWFFFVNKKGKETG